LRRKDTKGTDKDKQFLKDYPMAKRGSILHIATASNQEKKKCDNYPTQKPEELLNVFIETFTNKGDLVADFFCGCGTTLEASFNLKRNFIGCDGQKIAIDTIEKRMKGKEKEIKFSYPFENIPESLRHQTPEDFQRNCVLMLEGIPNPNYTGDGGVDGIRIKDGAIIQVKKSKNVGRPVIQSLLGVMASKRKNIGICVALSFAENARNFANSVRKDGYEIILKTASQLQKEQKTHIESQQEMIIHPEPINYKKDNVTPIKRTLKPTKDLPLDYKKV